MTSAIVTYLQLSITQPEILSQVSNDQILPAPENDSLMLEAYKPLLEVAELSYFAQQILPLVVLLAIPAFALFARAHWEALLSLTGMVLESLGLSIPWLWNSASNSGSDQNAGKKTKRKKTVRTRVEQLATNGDAIHSDKDNKDVEDDDDLYYPGLVNISGTYCFLNSVLQALASLSYLQPHIEAIHSKAVDLDVPTPVVDALRDTLISLNTPRSSSSALRPVPMINALSQPEPGKRSKLFSSREHQDAQELFQLVSECMKNESLAVDKEGQRDRGLGSVARLKNDAADIEVGTSVFDGLTANRRSCVECGYTEAVMHFSFDTWQLSLPRSSLTTLQDCLQDYIRLEVLTDCICRKCSLRSTYERLAQEANRLQCAVEGDENASQSKKKRAKDAKRLVDRVKKSIEEGRIEEDIKGVKVEKVLSRASTKQAMVARPPRVLVLHLNRSMHFGSYAGRNPCRVLFSEILDLTPYTTSGQLSTTPSAPISAPPPSIPRSTTPTQSIYTTPRVLYRLSSVVCHYGAHAFGHYVCFRRRPRASGDGDCAALSPPKMTCPYGCECTDCQAYGPVREDRPPTPGRGWLRISDDSVEECGIERVLAEGVGAFMLFYERVVHPRPAIYLAHSPRSSEETVRPPDLANGHAESNVNGSTWSVATLGSSGITSGASSVASSYMESSSEMQILRPRVVRRTTAGRSRSTPTMPNGRASSDIPSPGSSFVESPPSPVKVSKQLQNGHAHPAFTDDSPPSLPAKNDEILPSGSATPETKPSSLTISSEGTAMSTTPSESATTTRPPSPTPSLKAAQARIPAPQPLRNHISSTIIPDRAPVGLRA